MNDSLDLIVENRIDLKSDSTDFHHDVKYMDNGNILLLGREPIDSLQQLAIGIVAPMDTIWSDFVWEIKPTGPSQYNLVWQWNLKNHLIQDKDPSKNTYAVVKSNLGKIDMNFRSLSSSRPWFVNSIDYNDDRDEILLNTELGGETWIIDHSTTTDEAKGNSGGNSAKGGQIIFRWGNPQSYQRGNSEDIVQYGSSGHNWIPPGYPDAGKILFTNGGDDRIADPLGLRYATIEMIQPSYDSQGRYILNADSIYQTDIHEILFAENQLSRTRFWGKVEQLESGNLLFVNGEKGRITELTKTGNIDFEAQYEPFSNAVIVFGVTGAIHSAFAYKASNPIFDNLPVPEKCAIPQRSRETICSRNCPIPVTISANFDVVAWSTGDIGTSIEVINPGNYYFDYRENGDTLRSETIVIGVETKPSPPNPIMADVGDLVELEVSQEVAWFTDEECIEPFRVSKTYAVFNIQENRTFWIAFANDDIEGCYSDKVPYEIILETSATTENDLPEIIISPNPTSEYFILHNNNRNADLTSVTMLDMNGTKLELKSSGDRYKVSHLPTGLYFILIETNREQIVRKILVI